MHDIQLPQFEYQIKHIDDTPYIFDVVRKKHVIITPEEWVRQHMIHLMINQYNYPKSRISCERGLIFNGRKKRSDILVYDDQIEPFLLIECKAPKVKLCQDTFDQAATYNRTIKAPFICITNGIQTMCCAIDLDKNTYSFIKDLPQY